jgi:hypothetical protein
LELLATDGTTVLFSANSSSSGSLADPAAESFGYRIAATGRHFVRITPVNNATGSYHLLASRDNTDLRITEIVRSGTNVNLRLTTRLGRNYRIGYRDAPDHAAPWTPLPGILQGNGGAVQATNIDNTGQPRRFYRASQVP